jgi:hypothetical protein
MSDGRTLTGKSRLILEREAESVVLQRLRLRAKAPMWSSLTFQNKVVVKRLA